MQKYIALDEVIFVVGGRATVRVAKRREMVRERVSFFLIVVFVCLS